MRDKLKTILHRSATPEKVQNPVSEKEAIEKEAIEKEELISLERDALLIILEDIIPQNSALRNEIVELCSQITELKAIIDTQKGQNE